MSIPDFAGDEDVTPTRSGGYRGEEEVKSSTATSPLHTSNADLEDDGEERERRGSRRKKSVSFSQHNEIKLIPMNNEVTNEKSGGGDGGRGTMEKPSGCSACSIA